MKTIEEKLVDEVKFGYPISRKWSKKQFNQKLQEVRDKFITAGNSIKLVIAYTIYNEEQYIGKSLEECFKINDIDAIHLLDGAWEMGGDSINSTDKTKQIVLDFAKTSPIPVIFEENPHERLWETESEKRNYQLKRIKEKFGTKCYALVRDGDEIIRSSTGRNNIWLKKDLVNWYPDIGLILTYAYHSDIVSMIGARIIPMGEGIHYYSERSMIIHDRNCDLLLNYNPNEGNKGNTERNFVYQSIFFVNLWNIRTSKRLDDKSQFADFQSTQIHNNGKCTYHK